MSASARRVVVCVQSAARVAQLMVSCAVLGVGVAMLLLAVPGIGTVVQPLVVGSTVSVLLNNLSAPDALLTRVALLVIAFVVLAIGVAGYLGSGTLLVIVALGPAVDLIRRSVPVVGAPAARRPGAFFGGKARAPGHRAP